MGLLCTACEWLYDEWESHTCDPARLAEVAARNVAMYRANMSTIAPLTVDDALRRAAESADPLTRELARHIAHSRLCWQLLATKVDAALAQRSAQGGQRVPSRAFAASPGALLALQADARVALDGPIARVSLDELLTALDGVKG
jgi:hypothetical protein